MLIELSIKDFAIIDEISITFHNGLTVITGETGAGKSIIIDAIQLLTGGRGSVEYVRHGKSKTDIEGLFTIENKDHPVYGKGSQFGIDIKDDGMVVLQRSITSNGKSICRVNGKLVTLAILKEFGKALIDIHSQHETQSLMDPERHIELLDLYNKDKIDHIKKEYSRLFQKLESFKKRYKQLNQNEQEMAQRLDLLEFQVKEIQQAELSPDEDDHLSEERNSLANFEKIFNGLQDAYNALYGEQRGLDWLSLALTGLESASEFDETIEKIRSQFSDQYYLVEEMTFQIRNRLDELDFNPNRLNQLESRLNEINRLKKKYGTSVNDMLEYLSKVEDEIDQIKNRESHIQNIGQEVSEIGKDTLLEAEHLHEKRKEAAAELTTAIYRELKDLYLEKASFDVSIKKREGSVEDPIISKLHASGMDIVRFLITTNPGEPLKELHKIASGGELSRIMLALKKIFSRHQKVTSVIFDEVDTGVSGRVAQSIAEKIYDVSSGSQVLCISHLPQVAAMADTHLLIEKKVEGERTYTIVKELSKEDRSDEISRMITGAEQTKTTKQHAKELINLAEKFKNNQHVT
ncbi:DNA repair protein RecN [Aquibacillus sp. 3ASR75-11]|uniref:DNA repair protein RecN n=1 Tax=Terrihalobacillus insolitus TaxID=2950438 RepID=A0A9X3WST6_9BACI|nr:DNA repair protein RecN [Terrihalobacillus insolitus]MDC3414442.1 DNA repair protein RecN [Terrihalobacillus insolitus]MDC3425322.1 DNA repair protein RecN [Terrihalobacillus insolitus]